MPEHRLVQSRVEVIQRFGARGPPVGARSVSAWRRPGAVWSHRRLGERAGCPAERPVDPPRDHDADSGHPTAEAGARAPGPGRYGMRGAYASRPVRRHLRPRRATAGSRGSAGDPGRGEAGLGEAGDLPRFGGGPSPGASHRPGTSGASARTPWTPAGNPSYREEQKARRTPFLSTLPILCVLILSPLQRSRGIGRGDEETTRV